MQSIQLPSRDKKMLWIGGIIGLLSLIAIFVGDDTHHTRFWTSLLHNGVFFTLVAMMATFFIAVSRTSHAGWNVGFKRVWEAMGMFMLVGFVIMLIIALGNYFHWHHLYHWADKQAVASDEVLKGKSAFLNNNFYALGGLGILSCWIYFAYKLRKLSIEEDDHGDGKWHYYERMKVYAAIFLPIAGFSSAAAIWLWVMSIDAHWYSTMFAWYTAASCFVSMIAITILLLIYLKSRGYYHNVNFEHFHDLGKFLFAFSIFWTYLWFSQYMLIWYGNIGEETVYFQTRIREYPILFYGNLVMNFVLPFLILLRNDTKRKYGTLIFVSLLVFFGHWIDTFQMIKPGALHTAKEAHGMIHNDHEAGEKRHDAIYLSDRTPNNNQVGKNEPKAGMHEIAAAGMGGGAGSHGAHEGHSKFKVGFSIPGLADIGLMIGFLSLFVATTLYFLSKAPLVPRNDPFLKESLHHHT